MVKNKIFNIHFLFVILIILKGIDAVFEIIGGFAAFFIDKTALNKIVEFLVRRELEEDPGDIIAHYLMEFARQYTVSLQTFIGIYLLMHGLIKVFLVYYLLKRKLSVYPVAMAVFSLFVVYQIYAYSIRPSFELIALTALDIFIIAFTYFEYRNLKSR
jgi:uncharacterized membrane protein